MEEKISMKIHNPFAAGIDIGSRSHFVAVGQDLKHVREFGVYTSDHFKIIEFLKEHSIQTIAMESTGNYWQTLFAALQSAGFDVYLVSGKQIKNVKGKTDIKDCMWIQRLHSLGLLTSSFLPAEHIDQIRTYHRHRQTLNEECAKMLNKMQKSLRLMNIRLDVAISDISGKSGMSIISAILGGERDGKVLSELVHSSVKKSKVEIALAMQGQWKEELLYELKDCYSLYNIYQDKLLKCDVQIEKLLKKYLKKNKIASTPAITLKKKSISKNQPQIDLSNLSYQYTGVDLYQIEGMSHSTVMAFIAEVGRDIYKFPTSKHFTAWLRLAPRNKVSGGKVLSSRTPKGANRLAIALRNAANTVGQLKQGAISSFFKRIAFKKGRMAAITATARKMATIMWNMVIYKQQYKPLDEKIYNHRIKNQVITNIKRKISRLGITSDELIQSFS